MKKKQKPKTHRVVKRIVLIGLILLSVLLIFNRPIMEAYLHLSSDSNKAMKLSAAQMRRNAHKKGNYNSKSAVPISPANLVKAALSNHARYATGLIAVPNVGIYLPIYLDDSNYTMLYGAGQLQAHQQMGKGNYTLASHDMWTNAEYASKTVLFSPLKQAKKGDDVYLTDKTHVYHYVVSSVERILPTEWHHAVDPIKGKATVTLITCDTNDHYRIMVRGKLKSVKKFNNHTAKHFNHAYNQYKKQ